MTTEADIPEYGTYYVGVLDVENGVGPYSLSTATEDRPREIVEVETTARRWPHGYWSE